MGVAADSAALTKPLSSSSEVRSPVTRTRNAASDSDLRALMGNSAYSAGAGSARRVARSIACKVCRGDDAGVAQPASATDATNTRDFATRSN